MKNAVTIARREFSAHFSSPAAYIAIALFLSLLGVAFFFKMPVIINKLAFFDDGQASLRYLFEWMLLLFTVVMPAISMRLLAEERKMGTIEILMTMPVTELDVVLGKLLGSVGFLVVVLALTAAYPIMLAVLGNPDPGPIFGGYLGALLVGTSCLAIGLLASSWTSSQIAAFAIAVAICSAFTFIDRVPDAIGIHSVEALSVLSFSQHFRSIARGVVDSRDIVFFVGVTVVAVVWTVFSLESRKWRKGA